MNTVMNKISAIGIGTAFAVAALAAPAAQAQPTATTLQDQIAALLAQIAALQAQISGGTTTTVGATTTTTTYVHPGVTQDFTRDLSSGSRGEDVKALQKVLNMNPATKVAATGAGSPGNETSYYGSKTKKAVQAFQAVFGLSVDGKVGPQTRAELNKKTTVVVPGTNTGGNTTTTSVVTGNKLVVSGLASNDLLVGPSQKVIFSKLTLTAGDNDVMIKDIMTEMSGSANRNVIEKVTLLDSAMLELDSDNVDSDKESKLDADIIVKAGKTATLYVGAVMHDNTTGGNTYITDSDGLEVSLKVTSIVTGGANIEGTPIAGAIHTVKNNVTVDSFDAEITKDENSPKIGETVKVVTVTVDNSTNDPQTVKSLKLKRQGNASDDALDNIEISVNGKTYKADQNDDEYTFDFGGGVEIADGDDVDLKLYVDIADDSGRTVGFDIMDITVLDENGQILSEADASDGYTAGNGAGEWTYGSTATIGNSSFVLSKTSDISDSNVSAGSDEAELASFKVDVDGEWVEGDVNVQVTLTAGAVPTNWSDYDLENIAIYEKDGSRVSDKEDLSWTANGQATVSFDTVKFDDGITEYVLKGEINKDAADGTTYVMDDVQVVNAETKSGDSVGPFPSSPKSLNLTHSVEGAVIAVKANAPSPATVTADNSVGDNGSEQIVAEIELDAEDSGDNILVTEVKFDLVVTDSNGAVDFTVADVTNCSLEESTDTEDAGTSMTFSLDETVTKDTKKTLLVKCDIGSDALATDTIAVANLQFDAEGVSTGTNFNNVNGTGTPSVAVTTPVLIAKEHSDNPDAFVVMENESNILIATMEVEADKGDVKVDTITAELSQFDIADNGKVKVYVDGIYKGDITLAADATPVASEALNFTVKDGEKAKVEFKISTPVTAPSGVNATGALSVSIVTLSDASTGTLTPSPIAFNDVTVVSAMPEVVKIGNDTITTTTSLEADKRLTEFKVTAVDGDVTLGTVDFDIDATNMQFNNAELKVYSDSSYNNEVTTVVATGITQTLTLNQTISEGDTYYFVYEGDVQVTASGASATVEVKDDLTGLVFTTPAVTGDLLLDDDMKTVVNTTL